MTTIAPPPLADLGPGLVGTGRRQRWVSLSRPYAGILIFAAVVHAGWWWAAPLVMFGIFVAVVTVTHDVVHGCLGLRRRGTEWALLALGVVLLESGHAYRVTHLQHHRTFPGPDDPEGYPARLTFLGAVLYGPAFLARLWVWAYRRSARDRVWLVVEALVPLAVVATGIALWPVTKTVLVYAVMAVAGSWVYPLLTVYLPHHDYGDTPWTQTRTLRGRLLPAVFLELTYHLEHHLYPQVPSHRLPELARRLEPVLRRAGVRPRRVP